MMLAKKDSSWQLHLLKEFEFLDLLDSRFFGEIKTAIF